LLSHRKTNTHIDKSNTLTATVTWLAHPFCVQTNPDSVPVRFPEPEDRPFECNCAAGIISWSHTWKAPPAANRQVPRILARWLERRFFQPEDKNDCINQPRRMVLDKVQTKLIE
jgi:hypothetical protein